MFGKMFGGGPKFEPMQNGHIPEALRFIAETDEDDAEDDTTKKPRPIRGSTSGS